MKKISKKDLILLIVSAAILTAVAIFVFVFWETAYDLAMRIINGVDRVEDYVLSLGWTGFALTVLLIVACFFFPVISSAPLQIVCGIAYGILGGSITVFIAFTLATQLFFLFRQNLRVFSSPRQLERRAALEKRIKESGKSIVPAVILAFMLPAVPFIVICNLAASSMRWWKYTLIVCLGMIPDILVTIYVGEKLLSTSPVASVISLTAIIIVVTLSMMYNDKLIEWMFRPKADKGENK